MPMAMGVPMTAAALLDTTLVRMPIMSIRPIITAVAEAPELTVTNTLAR